MDGQLKTIPVNNETVKFISRTCTNEEKITYFIQSGSGIEFKFKGKFLSTEFYYKEGSTNNFYPNIEITKTNSSKTTKEEFLIDDKNLPYKLTLIDTENEEETTIKIIKLTEEILGQIGIKQFELKSSNSNPIEPLPKKPEKIEFIGDSILCGFGIKCKSEREYFSAETEDFTKTYAYLTAEKLNMDYFTCCYSNYGVITGATPHAWHKSENNLVMPFYEKVGKHAGFDKFEWDFDNNQCDFVVVNLGTFDRSYVLYKEAFDEFEEEYFNALKKIREKQKNSYIICMFGMMGDDNEKMYKLIEKAVEKFKKNVDEKIKCFLAVNSANVDGYGGCYLPNEKCNEKNADVLVKIIEEIKNK